MRDVGRWVMRRVRLYRPDGNALRRRTDRIESFVVLVCGLLFTGSLALAFATGGALYRAGVAAERSGHWVAARVLRDAPAPRTSVDSVRAELRTPVSWTDVRGRTMIAEAPVFLGTRAGSTVRVWLDAKGRPGGTRPDRAMTVARAMAGATGTVTVTGGLLLGCFALVRRSLDRRRYAAWDVAWLAAGKPRGANPETT
ncbi:Rv1733c family protein [Sphaerisporangium aureirubrum]|uniref:Integral membrane protein n=1 Tax=Sphaerisporangium aureirubrum TaxID=1544736 RepID=A0ABW1NR77_9ACTN